MKLVGVKAPVHQLSMPDEKINIGYLQFFAQLMGGYEYKNRALITAHVSASVNFFSRHMPSKCYENYLCGKVRLLYPFE